MEVIQLDWQFRYIPSDFCRRISSEGIVSAVMIIIGLEIRQLSLQVDVYCAEIGSIDVCQSLK